MRLRRSRHRHDSDGVADCVEPISGFVRAWGYNDYGQATVPADLGVCSQIEGGLGHTIAITHAGLVRVWGSNSLGQATTPTGLGICTPVAAGWYHSVALTQTGAVHAWGYNAYEQVTVPATLGFAPASRRATCTRWHSLWPGMCARGD